MWYEDAGGITPKKVMAELHLEAFSKLLYHKNELMAIIPDRLSRSERCIVVFHHVVTGHGAGFGHRAMMPHLKAWISVGKLHHPTMRNRGAFVDMGHVGRLMYKLAAPFPSAHAREPKATSDPHFRAHAGYGHGRQVLPAGRGAPTPERGGLRE